jgi:hypothetical protein
VLLPLLAVAAIAMGIAAAAMLNTVRVRVRAYRL